tara:strand:- start:1333 stop:2163 length:831 start_codon:yes stop_codon:yes gene_type:complete
LSTIKQSRVVIIVGGGDLPKIIVNHLIKNDVKFFCIGFLKNPFNNYLKKFNYKIINFGKIVTILKKLNNEGFDKLIMAGNLLRPSITDIKPDINSLKLLPSFTKKILQSGDNTLLSFAINNLEKMGYQIISLNKIIPSLFAGRGNLSKTKITNRMYKNALKAKEILNNNSKFDIGQSLIMQEGKVIGIEAIEGTDELINRSSKYLKKKKEQAILVKLIKNKQDLRVDLPTIGIKTINNCVKSHIKGVIYSADKTIFINKTKILEISNNNNIILYGI